MNPNLVVFTFCMIIVQTNNVEISNDDCMVSIGTGVL